MSKLTIDQILWYLDYLPSEGSFVWARPTSHRVSMGMEFGTVQPNGYRAGRLLGQFCYVHRLVWLVETEEWPTRTIDHLDGNPLNNLFSNLRDVSQSKNLSNARKHRHNTSGVTGVGYHTASGKWRAYIGHDAFHLGWFDTKEAAIAARQQAEIALDYTTRHGK